MLSFLVSIVPSEQARWTTRGCLPRRVTCHAKILVTAERSHCGLLRRTQNPIIWLCKVCRRLRQQVLIFVLVINGCDWKISQQEWQLEDREAACNRFASSFRAVISCRVVLAFGLTVCLKTGSQVVMALPPLSFRADILCRVLCSSSLNNPELEMVHVRKNTYSNFQSVESPFSVFNQWHFRFTFSFDYEDEGYRETSIVRVCFFFCSKF